MNSAGSNLPYHFRPSKFVDRQIFFDLLSRYSKHSNLDEAGYVSMGAYTMSDHAQIYRKLGISKLLTFDHEEHIVPRSHFNRPIENCHCKRMATSEVAAEIDTLRAEINVGNHPLVVWFDYTQPYSSSTHDEIGILVSNLRVGDVIKITVNAKPENYRLPVDRKKRLPNSKKDDLLAGFIKQFKSETALDSVDFHVGSFSDDNDDQIHRFILNAIIRATSDALERKDVEFVPLCSIAYRDGAPMYSLSGTLIEPKDRDSLLEIMNYETWPFAISDTQPFMQLQMGQMTLREYLLMDRLAGSDVPSDEVAEAFGFERFGDLSTEDYYERFRLFSRHYPSFLEVAT